MSILATIDASNNAALAPRSQRRGNGDNATNRQPAKVWLNVGYEANGKFVNLPVGIAIDTMEPVVIRGQNEEYASLRVAQNNLLSSLQSMGDSLEPGQEAEVNLKIQLRKVAPALDIKADETNEFVVDLSNLLTIKPPASAAE